MKFLISCIPLVILYCSSPIKPIQQDQQLETITTPVDSTGTLKKAYFAAGCFWCMEAIFESVVGVQEVISGYSGGDEPNPTYEQVGSGETNHAESIEIWYDPTKITFDNLLSVFFDAQDPTQVDGQGPDHGHQYRSIVFYQDDIEKTITMNYINTLNQSGSYPKPIVTEVVPFKKFWPAEKYHQNYVRLNPSNPYVQHESIPRLKRSQARSSHYIKLEKVVK